MVNPVLHSSLFVTPKSFEQLDEYIRQLPDGERAVAYKFTMYAFNLAHKLVDEEIAKCQA